jgi:hypothetical protein
MLIVHIMLLGTMGIPAQGSTQQLVEILVDMIQALHFIHIQMKHLMLRVL